MPRTREPEVLVTLQVKCYKDPAGRYGMGSYRFAVPYNARLIQGRTIFFEVEARPGKWERMGRVKFFLYFSPIVGTLAFPEQEPNG